MHVTGRLQTRRYHDPDTGEIRLRTEIIAADVIFLGGIQQSHLPPEYYLAEGQEQLPTADESDLPIDDRDARLRDD